MKEKIKIFIDYNKDESKMIIFDEINIKIIKEEKIKFDELYKFDEIFFKTEEVVINIDGKYKDIKDNINAILSKYNKDIRFVSFRKTEKLLVVDYLYLKKYKDIAYFLVEEKLNGALMINNKIIKGYNSLAGTFDVHTMKNKEFIEKLRDSYSIFYQSILEEYDDLTLDIIVESKQKGDKLASIIYDKIINLIVKAIKNVVLIVDPEVVILNTATKKHQNYILSSIKKEFDSINESLKIQTKIIESPSKNESILVIWNGYSKRL